MQANRPWTVLLLALLTMIPAGLGASGLTLKPDFAELLPDGKESVIEMRRVSERLPGASTLSLYVETKASNPAALEAFVDEVAPRLQALGPEWVGSVDAGVKESQKFFEKHKLLYADHADLKKAHDEIQERYDYEVAKASGTLLDEGEAPPPITAESIKKRLQGDRKEDPKASKKDNAYPRGYYENADGTYAALLVKTPVSGSVKTAEFRRKVEAVVAEVNPKRFDPSMEVRYTGGLITSAEEYNAIVNDLAHVGGLGLLGVLGSVLLFFWRVRTVLVMAGSLLVGLLWTFGLTRLTIGYLNSSTGFLVSIIAGNGINYGIMYMARYLEARRGGSGVEEAIQVAHRDSWVPTLASAATAMLAYGSLMFTDFRGFKHFGVIGSYGMILCWACAYLFAPALLAATERVWPAFREGKREESRGIYGVLFARLAMANPRTITAIGAVLSVVSLGMAVRYFSADPMEYDMANIRNERRDQTAAGELSKKVDRVVGQLGQDGLAIMTERLDQVPLLEAELYRRRAAASPDKVPFDKVVTIFSLLPSRQEEKLPLIEAMLDRIQRARKRGFLSDKDWAELAPHLPTEPVRALTIQDLPEQVARPFMEKDGTLGRIVYISPAKGFSVWDAHYLMRWADSFRSTTLPTGEVIKGSGQAVIFADMIRTIGEDAPKAILVAALGSVLVIVVAFRGQRHALGVFVPWLVGVAALVAFLQYRGVKLNFLNFVALPITIGIGAEYAHNLMQRYRIEGDRNLYRVVVETGGAVVLCSLTTTIGYLALLRSINKGIVSFGLAAAVGEITCVVAAVLLLPAFLAWRARRREARGQVFEGEAHFDTGSGPPSAAARG
jgi:predicted RND superfamily exporter protein